MVNSYNGLLFSLKGNEALKCTTMIINLEIIKLSEMGWSQKIAYSMIAFI